MITFFEFKTGTKANKDDFSKIKESIKKMVHRINMENFQKNQFFDFTLTKNGNKVKTKSQVYL